MTLSEHNMIPNHKHDVYISNSKCNYIFDVNELIVFAKNYEVVEIHIKDIEHTLYSFSNSVLDYDTENRINDANLSYPIILVSNNQQKIIAVLDGTHRIRKTIKLGIKKIKAIIIPKKDMIKFNSSKKLGQIIVDTKDLKIKELKLLQYYIQEYLKGNNYG